MIKNNLTKTNYFYKDIMSERTLKLSWCSFTCYANRKLPENVRLIELQPVFDEYKIALFNERILNNDRIWCDFFETYLKQFGFDYIENLAIVEDKSNPARKFKNFGFFENTVEITFQESENKLTNFVEIIGRLYEIIYKDIVEILTFFDLECNYLISSLNDDSCYESDFDKRFESNEAIFYNVFEPIRIYLGTHFKGHDISRDDFVYGELNVFEI